MEEFFNIDLLRKDLINYYGTAAKYNSNAMADLIKIESLNDIDLIEYVIDNNIINDFSKYIINDDDNFFQRRL